MAISMSKNREYNEQGGNTYEKESIVNGNYNVYGVVNGCLWK